MVPSSYVFLDSLPLTASGKVDRAALPMPDDSDTARVSNYIAPRDQTEQDLVAIWEEVLRVKPVGIADDFFDLGGHSLLAVRLFSRIEQSTGRKLPVRILFEEPTVEGLAEALKLHRIQSDLSPLVPIKTNGSKIPIFWIHAAGGHVLSYRHLAHHLGEDRPFYALQAREIESDLDPASTVEGMAQAYIGEIMKIQPHGPYLLGGLSFGGLVAWEMAQQLQQRGESVAQVVLLDTRHPDTMDASRLQDSLYRLRQRLQFHAGNLAGLEAAHKVRYLKDRWRISLRRLRYWLLWQRSIIRSLATREPRPRERISYSAALKARGIYRPKVYSGKVALFLAETQPPGESDATLGWGSIARGGLDIYEVPGAHASMIVEPHVEVLAEKLRKCLEIAERVDNDA
jgi:aspartate racemase